MSRLPDRCPLENESCKYFNSSLGCHVSRHHLYYPRHDYATPTEKRFRLLAENIIGDMCREEHDETHATQEIPEKPDLEFMQAAIRRVRDERSGQQSDGTI